MSDKAPANSHGADEKKEHGHPPDPPGHGGNPDPPGHGDHPDPPGPPEPKPGPPQPPDHGRPRRHA